MAYEEEGKEKRKQLKIGSNRSTQSGRKVTFFLPEASLLSAATYENHRTHNITIIAIVSINS